MTKRTSPTANDELNKTETSNAQSKAAPGQPKRTIRVGQAGFDPLKSAATPGVTSEEQAREFQKARQATANT